METKVSDLSAPPSAEPGRQENREHPRFQCNGTVELRRIPPQRESIWGKIVNLSEGGCFLETQHPLETGVRLVMELRVHGIELRLIAEVRSVKTDGRCWAGLEFVGISREGLAMLKTAIDLASRQARPPESTP